MKSFKYLLLLVFIFLLTLSCSSYDDYLYEPRCFVVKEKNTITLISDARIWYEGPDAGCGKYMFCEPNPYIFGHQTTDQHGESCKELIVAFRNYKIKAIVCEKNGYKPFRIDNPPSNFSVIYLEPI